MNRLKAGCLIVLVMVVILTLVAAVVAVWLKLSPDDSVNLSDAVSPTLAAGSILIPLATWLILRLRPAVFAAKAVTPEAAAHAEISAPQVLADLVGKQWRIEAQHSLLDDPEPIPVHWQLIADQKVVSIPRLITAEAALPLTGRSDDIAAFAEAFRGLSQRRLVITGGEGMGKTTLAIQLLLQLLSTREADQASASQGEIVPIPVLLPVSGWDTHAYPRLQKWLAVRLAADYPALQAPQLGPGAAAALVEGGHILPVLDGLDEIAAPARAQVIVALNNSLSSRDQLILTSRRAEFTTAIRDAGRPLTAAAVIVPKPVTAQAAADYLAACLPASPSDAWIQLLAALRSRTAPGLTQLAATPLGLWLIRSAYLAPGADPAPLAGPLGADTSALRAHLLDLLIPALIKARPPSTIRADHFRPRHQLDPATTRRYLTYLARTFPPVSTREIAWWRIAGTTPHIRPTVRYTVASFVGLPWLITGLMFTLALKLNPLLVLAAGLGSGLLGLLAGAVAVARDWPNELPGYAKLRLRGQIRPLFRYLRDNFPVSSSAPRLGGPKIWLADIAGLLVGWVEQPTLMSISTPRSTWQADRLLNLVRLPTFALVFVITFGLLAGLQSSSVMVGLAVALFAAFNFGPIGIIAGDRHAWLVCNIAVARLAFARLLPYKIMDFLDDVHRLGLMRTSGPVYQFRHTALHDYLAAAPSGEAS